MGFEAIHLFTTIEVDMEATQSGTLTLSTDVPTSMAVRATLTVPSTARRAVRLRIPQPIKGNLVSVKYSSSGQTRLYGIRIYGRELPRGAWTWYALPCIPSDQDFRPVPLPIPGISGWAQVNLPIPGVSEWAAHKLPIKPTPPVPEWIDLPMDE